MVHVYDSPLKVTILTENDELRSEEPLPEFRCLIADILQSPTALTQPQV